MTGNDAAHADLSVTVRYGTKAHNIRIPDDVWAACMERAEREGTTVSAVVNKHLRRYGKPTG